MIDGNKPWLEYYLDCKYFTGMGFCAIEYLQGRKCCEITDCYYKQNKTMHNALRKILSLDCKKDCKRQWDCITCKMWQAQEALKKV